MGPNVSHLIEATKAKREAAGLHVRWLLPADAIGPEREWSAYASSPEQRDRWMREKARLGWRLISTLAGKA